MACANFPQYLCKTSCHSPPVRALRASNHCASRKTSARSGSACKGAHSSELQKHADKANRNTFLHHDPQLDRAGSGCMIRSHAIQQVRILCCYIMKYESVRKGVVGGPLQHKLQTTAVLYGQLRGLCQHEVERTTTCVDFERFAVFMRAIATCVAARVPVHSQVSVAAHQRARPEPTDTNRYTLVGKGSSCCHKSWVGPDGAHPCVWIVCTGCIRFHS